MENTNNNRVYILAAVMAVAVIGGLLWYLFGRTEVLVVAENLTVAGDYTVEKGTKVEITNGAIITVEGDTIISGEISGDENGVAIIAKENVTLDKDAKITSNSRRR